MYLADFDGTVEQHLQEIADIAAGELIQIGASCEDPIPATMSDRIDWLRNHLIEDATYYVNTIGRTVRQIRCEALLRDKIATFIDSQPRASSAGQDPGALRQRIQTYVQ